MKDITWHLASLIFTCCFVRCHLILWGPPAALQNWLYVGLFGKGSCWLLFAWLFFLWFVVVVFNVQTSFACFQIIYWFARVSEQICFMFYWGVEFLSFAALYLLWARYRKPSRFLFHLSVVFSHSIFFFHLFLISQGRANNKSCLSINIFRAMEYLWFVFWPNQAQWSCRLRCLDTVISITINSN